MPKLFRKEAVENLGSPGRLDARLQVVTPKFWMPLVAIGVLLVAAVVWSICGRVSVHIEGKGLLIRSQHLQELRATDTVVINRVLVQPGTFVRKDEALAEIEAVQGAQPGTQVLKAPIDGMLIDSILKAGRRLKKDELYGAIGTFGGSGESQLCMAFLKLNEGQLASIGLPAYVIPEVARSAHRSALEARVVYVRPFPISTENLQGLLDDKTLAEMLIGTDRLAAVIVEMPTAKRRTPDGELVTVNPGTLASVRVEIERKPAAAFLFPGLNDGGSTRALTDKSESQEGGSGNSR